jgi:thioester reductase-like protein
MCRLYVNKSQMLTDSEAGGVLLTLLKSLYQDIVSVFQPPAAALNAELFDAILRHGRCSGCVIPPYLLEEMLTDAQQFDTLASLDFVQFGSGPLSQKAGETLLTRQKDCPHFIGSSECGLYILLELDDPATDWQYFRFHPWTGADFRPIDDTNQICELFIVRSDAPKIPGLQPVFELFPELKEWPTKDLYVRHPSKPDHWRCIGRNDDVLVLSNGEKLNPVDTEGRIANSHPSVTGALVIGQGRFAPSLLLEVRDVNTSDPLARAQLIASIWPLVRAANRDAPSHGQLSKELILLTTPDKPFLRTPKLSIRRKPTVDLYADDIDQIYNRYSDGVEDGSNDLGDSSDLRSISGIQTFLARYIQSETGWDHQPGPDDDLFMLGVDSLQVTRMTRTIKAALARQGVHGGFEARAVYSNSTLKSLSEAILKMANAAQDTINETLPCHQQLIDGLIDEYSDFGTLLAEIRETPASGGFDQNQQLNVILTGSTGSLGSHLLLALLAKPQLDHVYCLNRAEDARARQIHLLSEQGIDVSHIAGFESRVHFLHATSLDAPHLGLVSSEDFDLLKSSKITHVIHNAWPVNFNILGSFKSHIAGVRALIDFCGIVPEHPGFMFLSSLSSITSFSTRQTVLEDIVSDPSAPSPMGYGESKYVAEHVLNRATGASQGAISSAILRIGQIAGPAKSSKAAWPAREWLPSLVISSKTIGVLPESLGRMDQVDWVPVDSLADSICELLDSPRAWGQGQDEVGKHQSNVFHVFNPSAVPWAELLPSLKTQIGVDKIVPLKDWIGLVRQGPEEDASMHRNPARKILQFYEALESAAGGDGEAGAIAGVQMAKKRFELGNMARCSKTFEKLQPISGELLSQWARRWE